MLLEAFCGYNTGSVTDLLSMLRIQSQFFIHYCLPHQHIQVCNMYLLLLVGMTNEWVIHLLFDATTYHAGIFPLCLMLDSPSNLSRP